MPAVDRGAYRRGMARKTYVGAAGKALTQGMFAACWSAARGLSPGRRWAVRAGAVLASTAIVAAQSRHELAGLWTAPHDDGEPSFAFSRDPEVAARMEAEMRPIFRPGEVPDEVKQELKRAMRRTLDDAVGRYRRHPVLGGAALVLSAGLMFGGRRLERHWLATLERDRHPHPLRTVAVRMGLLTVASGLASGIVDVREDRPGR
jgi:hypothetical protein